MKKSKMNKIKDYDNVDTSNIIDKKHPKRLSDLNIELPDEPPTKTGDKYSSRIIGKGKGKVFIADGFDEIPEGFEKYEK